MCVNITDRRHKPSVLSLFHERQLTEHQWDKDYRVSFSRDKICLTSHSGQNRKLSYTELHMVIRYHFYLMYKKQSESTLLKASFTPFHHICVYIYIYIYILLTLEMMHVFFQGYRFISWLHILIIFGNIFNVFAPIWSMGNLYYLVIFILF